MRRTGNLNFGWKEKTFANSNFIKRFKSISQAFAAPADEPSPVANATVAEVAPVAPVDKNATETTDKNSTENADPKEISVQVTIIEEDGPNDHDIDSKEDTATDGPEEPPKPCGISEILRRLLGYMCQVRDRFLSGRKVVKENADEETKISPEDQVRLSKESEAIDKNSTIAAIENNSAAAAAPAATVAPVEVTQLSSAQSIADDIHEKIAAQLEASKLPSEAPVLPSENPALPSAATPVAAIAA